MPKEYKLKKAAESINKDYKRMEKYVPEMNKAISGNSEPIYDPRQSVQDAAYDAGRKFGERERLHENVFLWTDKKDVQEKQEKYGKQVPSRAWMIRLGGLNIENNRT